MEKPFKTYHQQIRILRKRNITINDGSKAMNILRTAGYYNVINGYKTPFLDKAKSSIQGEDFYKDGTTIEQIYSLYLFDRNLRNILLKYMLISETVIKTKMSYHFSDKYRQNFSYLDINNFNSTNPDKVTKLIYKISYVINNNSKPSSQGDQIYHYLNKYKNLPLWVLVNKMTMGEAFHFFFNLNPNMQNAILEELIKYYNKEYSQEIEIGNTERQCFQEMLDFMNFVRNICAHDERLYNIFFKKGKRTPNVVHFHVSDIIFKSRLFDCIIILKIFLFKKDFKEMVSKISKEVQALQKLIPPTIYNQILIDMGFSKSWTEDLSV